jgi:chromosome segregation ATPase
MGRQYDAESLRNIGERCINKLPPASAVQAMFLYEMQRETEAEKLFQGQLFELAKVQDRSDLNDKRVWDLEEQVKALRKQATSRDVQERIATSRVRTDDLASKVKQQKQRLDDQGERLVIVEEGLKARDLTAHTPVTDPRVEKHAHQIEDLTAQLKTNKAHASHVRLDAVTKRVDGWQFRVDNIETVLQDFNSDIGILFDERDAMVVRLEAADKRIVELESLTARLEKANIECSGERDALASRLRSADQQIEDLKATTDRLEKEIKTTRELLGGGVKLVDDRVNEILKIGAGSEKVTNETIQGLIARLQNTEVCNASLNTQLQIMQQQ